MINRSRSAVFVSLLAAFAAGCGRIGYDARDSGTSSSMDAALDAMPDRDGRAHEERTPMPDAEPMPCMAGRTRCGDECVDLRNDNRFCASCMTGCPIGTNCVDARCVPATNAPAGSECMDRATCGMAGFAPAVCIGSLQGWANGHCSNYCRSPADCLANEACVDAVIAKIAPHPDARGLCFVRCDTPGQRGACNAGYTCTMQRDGVAVCTASCEVHPSTCGANACNAVTGQCERCTTPAECAGGGACEAGVCRCTAMTECGLWSVCNERSGRCGCSNDFYCATGMRCDLASGLCVTR